MNEWLDFGFRISINVVCLATWVLLLITYIRKTIKETKNKAADSVMKINKEVQKKKEEELKDMAVFLCDKCGAQTQVADAKTYKEFDVCPSCLEKLSKRDADVTALDAQIAQYKKVLEELQAQRAEKEKI